MKYEKYLKEREIKRRQDMMEERLTTITEVVGEDSRQILEVQKFWHNKDGKDLVPMMVMEEAGELIQAISKMERKPDNDEARQNLIDEIGDMYICLGELIAEYDLTEDEIERRLYKKLRKEY